MTEFIESAKRETGDTGVVSFLTTILIVGAGVLLIATSLSLV